MNSFFQNFKWIVPFMLVSAIFFNGCRGINPADEIPASTSIRFPLSFLSLCGLFVEGVEGVQLDWNVDAIGMDGNPFSFASDRLEFDNDDHWGDLIDLIEISVPESGTYSVTVDIELTCSSCCASMTTRNGQNGCTGNRAGLPIFRGTSLMINQTPPTGIIEITPVFDRCFTCGCND